jgi:small neutral amino acid transporter SnatA (MarC family)
MNDFTRAAVGIFAVLAVPAALRIVAAYMPSLPRERLRLVSGAALFAFVALSLVAAVSSSFLDWLDVSAENFQLAASVVMLPLAIRLLWTGETWTPSATSPFWRTVSLLLGPVPVVATLSYSARFGFGDTLAAAAAALLLSAALLMAATWLLSRAPAVRPLLGGFNGALIILLAIELMLDGIHSV